MTAIRFFAPVNDQSSYELMKKVDELINRNVDTIKLLISTPGGSVFHGLSIFNYLKGIPSKVITHNFGQVDSIGVVIFCAGDESYSSPQARFLIHGVSLTISGNVNLEEPQIEERLRGLKTDMDNISKVIAARANKSVGEVNQAMLDRITLNPGQAKEWGLVDEITSELFQQRTEVITITGQ